MFNYKHTLSFLLFTIMLMVQPPTRILTLQAGELDPSFGDMGRLITNIENFPYEALLQSDGKILVATVFSPTLDTADFLLVRLNMDGRLDESFGIGGQMVTDVSSGVNDIPTALAIQPDGKILVAGGSLVLVRYLPTGALDPSFDQDGILIFDLGYGGSINAIKILPDDRILAIGVSAEYAYANRLVLARFLPDGRIDTSFGNEGKITYDNDYGAAGVAGVLVQPDGQFIVGGSVSFKQHGGGTYLWRFQPNGSPDESFGLKGKVYIESDYTKALVLQPDGKIVTAAHNFTGSAVANLLMRFTSDGSLDPSFGLNGKVYQNPDEFYESAYDIQYQGDGKLLVSGQYVMEPNYKSDFLLRRFLPDGSPDITFGSNGKITSDFINFDFARYIRLYLDGRILAVGATTDDEGHQFICLARYLNDWPILSNHVWFPLIRK